MWLRVIRLKVPCYKYLKNGNTQIRESVKEKERQQPSVRKEKVLFISLVLMASEVIFSFLTPEQLSPPTPNSVLDDERVR